MRKVINEQNPIVKKFYKSEGLYFIRKYIR